MEIEKIMVRTNAEAPSVEVITKDGVSAKLTLGSSHDWKVKNGEVSKEDFIELNMCYHKCFGKGYNKKQFVRQMKRVITERMMKKPENGVDNEKESDTMDGIETKEA